MIGCWNIRGAGSKRSLLAMQDLKYRHKLDMLVILEPRISSSKARKVISQLGFPKAEISDAVGFSGGIWLLWDDSKLNLRVIHCMDQAVSVCVETAGGTSWIFTAVYGHPCPSKRSYLWQNLSIIAASWNLPWVVCGDFNDILFEDEKLGKLSGKSRGFKDWFDQHGLIDLGFLGPKFTWVNKRFGGDFVMKRLDRAICNKEWRVFFPEAFVRHLPRRCSDHSPILLSLNSDKIPSSELKPFRFEAMWLKHCLFPEFIKAEWKNLEGSVSSKLDNLIPLLREWNTQVFGQIFQKKKRILARLQGIQRSLCKGFSPFLSNLEKHLQQEFEDLLDQEDVFWKQKSRVSWLQGGDRNTKFFHITTLVRRRRNRIERLKDINGDWISSKEGLKTLAVEYFHGLFLDDVVDIIRSPLPSLFPHIPEADLAAVSKEVTAKEVQDALFAIGPYKAPGPDGYSAIFFHNCWSLCRKDIEDLVFKCFSSGSVPEYLNSTLVTLVPKIINPQSMLQFRPISLCNTLYKVVSKIIVGRLRPLMCKLVSPNQVSFVPGRQISDNIFIAQEVLHRFYRARGKTGYIAWKIDLSKAYDRLKWSFIEQTLEEIGIGETSLQLIMSCVKNVSYRVLMNGELTASFKPQRGVRQGDPLSPYLFVLCMEKLSHIIAARVLKKEWKAVRAARSGPLISHLFFADDLILFGEASVQQAMVMKNSLEEFCELSGQQVNFEKSLLYISANTKPDLVDQIEQTCGVTRSVDMGNYLGVPLVQGRVTKATYKGVLVKVQAKLSAWKSQLLSMASRITLIQSVVSSIPLYTMQTAKLPQALCDDLDKSSKSFLWGSSENHHKTHLVKWDTVCLPKRLGGLGIKKAALMNQAMLSKASWRIVAGDSGLWAAMLRKKYLKGSCCFDAYADNCTLASSSWKGLIYGAAILNNGLKWRVGDGTRVKFWTDTWIGDIPLIDTKFPLSDQLDKSETVSNYFSRTGWNINKLLQVLLPEAVMRIVSIHVDIEGNLPDTCIWGPTSNGVFSVKTAYELSARFNDVPGSPWNFIWNLKIPPRVKMFIWLLTQKKILTNVQRVRRKLSRDPSCPLCHYHEESLQHLFISCPRVLTLWRSFYLPEGLLNFFSSDFDSWLKENLCYNAGHLWNLKWCSVFAVACWFIWKWRCCSIFEPQFQMPCRPKQSIVEYLLEWDKANNLLKKTTSQTQMFLAWQPPPCGFSKLNIDGSRVSASGCIAAGGIIRNSEGSWIAGFSANLGHGEVLVAEAWALYYGLNLAWQMGLRQITVNSDSALVVDMVNGEWVDSHPMSVLLTKCRELLKSQWNCSILHVYRETNFAADFLAKMGHHKELGYHELSSPPDLMQPILDADKNGLLRPRFVSV
ncbi:uncharacterized protein LOC109947231 [Prunus persica]|uniref:uncharacterized protein LOC109947231 n=1 Tax=Prunus persica TaxID=3760 RepID=UPI0009AB30F6|nr:uncharacterized protein LOC109947231 [Prunus persica]